MGKFINPWVDRGFKILFGREISKDLLVDFLNDLFNGEHSIVDLTFLNVELPSETIEGRGAIFDLKCKDADGAVFIVEVQNAISMNADYTIFVEQCVNREKEVRNGNSVSVRYTEYFC